MHQRARATLPNKGGRSVGEVNDASRPGHPSSVLWKRANEGDGVMPRRKLKLSFS